MKQFNSYDDGTGRVRNELEDKMPGFRYFRDMDGNAMTDLLCFGAKYALEEYYDETV